MKRYTIEYESIEEDLSIKSILFASLISLTMVSGFLSLMYYTFN